MTIAWLAVAFVGVALSALYSGLETGVYCFNRIRLAARAADAPRRSGARLLLREAQHMDRTLATLLIGNNVANYLGTFGVAAALAMHGFSDAQVIAFNALVLTPALFVAGETIPKNLFRDQADRLAPALAWTLVVSRVVATATLLLPIVHGVGALSARALGARSIAPAARARVAALVKEGARHGVIEESQLRLIDRAFALRERCVADEMIPWRSVTRIGVDWSRSRVEDALRESGFSRYPVMDRRNRVVGVLDAMDVWLRPGAPVASLMRDATTLDADAPILDAIAFVRRQNADLCVAQRAGKPVGVVTRKDLAEPILGELRAW